MGLGPGRRRRARPLGDPLGDFTYLCLPWYPNGEFAALDLAHHGLPALDEYQATYCRRTGASPPERSAWYAAYQLYRGACIAQGIAGRMREVSAGTEDYAAAAEEIAAAAEQLNASTEEISSSATHLAEAAERLTGAVGGFKLD